MILDFILGPGHLTAFDEERFWSEVNAGAMTSAGTSITESTALNCSAVYRAIALISGLVSGLPLHVYRRLSDSERERVSDHRLEGLLNDEPNDEMDAQTFRETLQGHVLGWGNGYAEIQRVGAKPVALWPLHPSLVRPVRTKAGDIAYEVRNDAGSQPRTLDASRVFHLKNIGSDGLSGWSIIRLARESLGLTAAMQGSGAALFGNDSRPGGVLKHPGHLSPEAQRNLRESWERIHRGPDKARRLAVLTEGMEYSAIAINPEDAQWMQGRQFQIEEISRWFGVAPHLLYSLQFSTNNNIEHQGLEFLVFCLGYWLIKWEKAVKRQLLLESEKKSLYLEHVTEALTRADIETRYNAYATARTNGWQSVNDIRRKENQSPIGPQGDIYLSPGNMLNAKSQINPVPAPAPGAAPPNGSNPTPTNRMAADGHTEAHPITKDEVISECIDDAKRYVVADAHRALLADALGRLVRKECANVRQAARKPGEFLAWLDGYYPHHEKLVAQAIAPAMDAWRSVCGGVLVSAEELARQHCDRSRAALLELAGTVTPADLSVAVEMFVGGWEQSRAQATAAEVIP